MCFILKCKLVAALHNHILVIHYRAVGERRILAGRDACTAVDVSEKVKPRADLKDSCKQLVAAEAGPAVNLYNPRSMEIMEAMNICDSKWQWEGGECVEITEGEIDREKFENEL